MVVTVTSSLTTRHRHHQQHPTSTSTMNDRATRRRWLRINAGCLTVLMPLLLLSISSSSWSSSWCGCWYGCFGVMASEASSSVPVKKNQPIITNRKNGWLSSRRRSLSSQSSSGGDGSGNDDDRKKDEEEEVRNEKEDQSDKIGNDGGELKKKGGVDDEKEDANVDSSGGSNDEDEDDDGVEVRGKAKESRNGFGISFPWSNPKDESDEKDGKKKKSDGNEDNGTTDDESAASDNTIKKPTDTEEEEDQPPPSCERKEEESETTTTAAADTDQSKTDKNDDDSGEDKDQHKNKQEDKKQKPTRRPPRQPRTPPTTPQSPFLPNPYLLFPSSPFLPSPTGLPNGLPPSSPLPPPNNNNTPILLRIIEPLIPLLTRLLTLSLIGLLSSGSFPSFGQLSPRERIHHPPSPGQHFVLERVGERYRLDDVALRMALECPPVGVGGRGGRVGRAGKGWGRVLRRRRRLLRREMERRSSGDGGDGNDDGDDGKEDTPTTEPENQTSLQSTPKSTTKFTTKSTTNTSPIITPSSPHLYDRTVIILEINTDSNNIETVVLPQLRDAVSFLLRQYHDTNGARLYLGKELEVLVLVESCGGSVSEFGLAADQITRLRTAARDFDYGGGGSGQEEEGEGQDNGDTPPDLLVTVCVDRAAASGGYMIACQASPNRLYAAPFAVLGSIGVLRNSLNYHSLLSKYGIKPLLLTAGEAKAPLTSTSEVTEEKMAIAQRGLDRTHVAFREMVEERRGGVIDERLGERRERGGIGDGDNGGMEVREKIYEGDTFLGRDALGYGLVDRVVTSDEYVAERVRAGDRVLKLVKCTEKQHRLPSLLELLFLSNKLSDGGGGGGGGAAAVVVGDGSTEGGSSSSRGLIDGRRLVAKIGSKIGPLLKFGGIVGLTKLMDFGGSDGRSGRGFRWCDQVCRHDYGRDGDVSYRG